MSEAKNLKTRIISDNELNAVLSTEHRIKKLKTINKNTTQVRKSITERVRNLFNIIARLDFSFIQDIVYLKTEETECFLHMFRDNYILLNKELLNAFW